MLLDILVQLGLDDTWAMLENGVRYMKSACNRNGILLEKDITFPFESVADFIMHLNRIQNPPSLRSPYVYFLSLELVNIGQC